MRGKRVLTNWCWFVCKYKSKQKRYLLFRWIVVEWSLPCPAELFGHWVRTPARPRFLWLGGRGRFLRFLSTPCKSSQHCRSERQTKILRKVTSKRDGNRNCWILICAHLKGINILCWRRHGGGSAAFYFSVCHWLHFAVTLADLENLKQENSCCEYWAYGWEHRWGSCVGA